MDSQQIPRAIVVERQRQIAGEGYDARHDDEHIDGELLAVARWYYQRAIGLAIPMRDASSHRLDGSRGAPLRIPIGWPWGPGEWKPRTPQRDLERAGGLCLAEIDRLTRAGRRSVTPVEEQLALIVSAYTALPPPVPGGAAG